MIFLVVLFAGMALVTWNSLLARRAAEQERGKAVLACGSLYREIEKRSARDGEPPPHPAHCEWVD